MKIYQFKFLRVEHLDCQSAFAYNTIPEHKSIKSYHITGCPFQPFSVEKKTSAYPIQSILNSIFMQSLEKSR